MKKKTKMIIGIVMTVVVAIIVGGLFVFQTILNEETKKLEQESKDLETMQIETKDGEKIELTYFNFDDGRFFLKIPSTFSQMSEELFRAKYSESNPPTYAFSNENGTISISLSLSNAKMTNQQVEGYVKMTKEQMKDLFDFQKVNIYQKDDRTIGEMILVSKAEDTDIYNHMLVFSDKDYLRVINFNCTKELQENWQEVGEFIMKSLIFPVEEK